LSSQEKEKQSVSGTTISFPVNSPDSSATSLTSFRDPELVFFVSAMTTNPMANARSDHESAFLLYSLVYPSHKTVSDIAQNWEFYADAYVTAEKVWDIYTTTDIQPPLENCSGGTNGRLTAMHLIIPNNRSISRVVTLRDYRFQRVTGFPIPFSCTEIFFHVLPSDDLEVLTSVGLLLTFSDGHRVSLVSYKNGLFEAISQEITSVLTIV
jgi:hypothetical protein